MLGAPDALVGRAIGEFVVRERIGEGGFGVVYRAVQPALEREAVIKVLHPRIGSTRVGTERFLREAKLASRLDHPYAAHVYAFGVEAEGDLWIAMELVRGTPLDRLLNIQGPLPLERFVPLLQRICEVVHTAHEQGIVHRDLKPANVMVLSRAGNLLPKLLDFGIAKGLENAPHAHTLPAPVTARSIDELATTLDGATPPDGLTQRGAIVGSPPYMAPEQWLDAGAVDGRTDLYALGILSYECLTGRPPFTAKTVTAYAQAHALEAPPPLGGAFPAALDAVIGKVLAKEPGDRYPDAVTFAKEFRRAAGLGETVELPAIERARHDAVVTAAPQPIADAVVMLDAARNAHQARDALVQLARVIVRYLGLLALACRSRIRSGDRTVAIESIRALARRSLTDTEWLQLARELTGEWIAARDAYPVPELVDVLADGQFAVELRTLVELRELPTITSDHALAAVRTGVASADRVLAAIAFLHEYQLAVPGPGAVAERWMGAARQRGTLAVRGHDVPLGAPLLLDRGGVPVLALAPLFAVAAPTAGAPLELFLFEGRDPRGARLVALPASFEHHDDALFDWFRSQLVGGDTEVTTAAGDARAPYRGLSSFSAADGALFFGRERLVDAFVNRLRVQPLLAVVGRSGAGKSSFVQAGVLPALGWRAITMRPGSAPLATLAARLAQADIAGLDGDLGDALRADAAVRGPLVLVVDQLEELFTLCTDTAERQAFVDAIIRAARSPEDPVRVILAMRDDFLLRAEQVPALRGRIGQGLQLLTVPLPEDLRRILVEPARRAGHDFEDGLPDEMIRELADQPGALALLSFTAARMWELRDRHFKQLTRTAYKALGGVGGALAQHADRTLDELAAKERGLAREAFRHLVTTQNTRAVLARRDLRQLLGDSEHADTLIEKLVSARLLVASENERGAETIEIIHEALLTAWPRLVEWRREDVEGARFHEQLRTAARQWDERGRPPGLLWRGDALADYTRWRAKDANALTEIETAFADAGLREAARARRVRRGLLAASFAVLVVGLVVVTMLNARANRERDRVAELQVSAEDGRRRGLEEQGRKALLAGDPMGALVFATAARDAGADNTTTRYLIARTVGLLAKKLQTLRHPTAIRDVRVSDGRVFTISSDGEVRTWNLDGRARPGFAGHAGLIAGFDVGPDRLITGGRDGTVRIWDTRASKLVHTLTTGEPAITVVHLAPDQRSAITSGSDESVRWWDVASGTLRAAIPARETADAVFVVGGKAMFALTARHELARWDLEPAIRKVPIDERTPGDQCIGCTLATDREGSVVASASEVGLVELWRGADGKRIATLDLRVDRLAKRPVFDADGQRVAIAAGSEVQIWRVDGAHRIATMRGHTGDVAKAIFSHDGSRVASVSADGSARIWDAATGELLALMPGPDAATSLAFSDDDRQLVVSSGKRAEIWDARTDLRVRSLDLEEPVMSIALGKSGRVAACGSEGRVAIWRGDTRERSWSNTQPCVNLVFSPDEGLLATGGADGVTRLWNPASGAPIAELPSNKEGTQGVAFSPDGERLATADNDKVSRVWNVRARTLERTLAGGAGTMYGVAWAPDNSVVATCNVDANVRLWDPSSNASYQVSLNGRCYQVAFDRTGERFVAAGRDSVRIWRTRDRTLVRELEGRHNDARAVFATDDLMLTTSKDPMVRVWDAASGRLLDAWEHPGVVDTIEARVGEIVAVAYDHRVVVWRLPAPVDPEIVGRVLASLPIELRDDVLVRRQVHE